MLLSTNFLLPSAVAAAEVEVDARAVNFEASAEAAFVSRGPSESSINDDDTRGGSPLEALGTGGSELAATDAPPLPTTSPPPSRSGMEVNPACDGFADEDEEEEEE